MVLPSCHRGNRSLQANNIGQIVNDFRFLWVSLCFNFPLAASSSRHRQCTRGLPNLLVLAPHVVPSLYLCNFSKFDRTRAAGPTSVREEQCVSTPYVLASSFQTWISCGFTLASFRFFHLDLPLTLFPTELPSFLFFSVSSSSFMSVPYAPTGSLPASHATIQCTCRSEVSTIPQCDRTTPSPWHSVPSLVLLMGTFDSVSLNKLLPFCFRLFTWWLQSSLSISYLYFLFFVFGLTHS